MRTDQDSDWVDGCGLLESPGRRPSGPPGRRPRRARCRQRAWPRAAPPPPCSGMGEPVAQPPRQPNHESHRIPTAACIWSNPSSSKGVAASKKGAPTPGRGLARRTVGLPGGRRGGFSVLTSREKICYRNHPNLACAYPPSASETVPTFVHISATETVPTSRGHIHYRILPTSRA